MSGSRGRDELLIGELSARTGASQRSLRHYEAKGLLTSRRGPNGYRRYAPGAVDMVIRIKGLLALGLTLDVAADVLPCMDGARLAAPICADLEAVLRAELERLDVIVNEAALVRESIGSVLARASTAA